MREILSAIVVFGLFISTYLVAAFVPIVVIAGANYAIAPLDCWPAMAEAWLSVRGVPYPDVLSPIIYGLVVFYPSIRLATWLAFDVVDPRLTNSRIAGA